MSNIHSPEISVILPFYNSEKYLKRCIASILNQSFKNFELILINDGSTDTSLVTIKDWNDPRISLISLKHDYISSLNMGLAQARGQYIARMDADDIMHPDRLKIQYNILEKYRNIHFCASWATLYIEETGKMAQHSICNGIVESPLLYLLKGNPFIHPSMVFRRSFLVKNSLSYSRYDYAEDYKLWVDAALCGASFYVVPQCLIRRTIHRGQVSMLNREIQRKTSYQIKKDIIKNLLPKQTNEFHTIYDSMVSLEAKGRISREECVDILCSILQKVNYSL